ncbi:MAG: DUF3073 domain-containing protein [Microbacteriaceae bacterium]|nr:DUF3073 domain-containing protein [Microbacteriaceae bacterium]
MGRGRQKAKHTKVARDLKYYSPDTNYGALQRELTHSEDAEPDYVDKWADAADESAPAKTFAMTFEPQPSYDQAEELVPEIPVAIQPDVAEPDDGSDLEPERHRNARSA